MSKTFVINGGGLVGALAAAMLVNRAEVDNVIVYEKRGDLRKASYEAGRSINLVITSRGLYALRAAGLEKEALALCVPIRGRMMHGKDSSTTFQPYGIKPNEVNYSVSRTGLNCLLIDEAEKRGVKFFFNHGLKDIDFSTKTATYLDETVKPPKEVTQVADAFLGTDGVGSATRTSIVAQLRKEGLQVEDYFTRLGVSYKEVSFPAGPDDKYSMDPTALHIWPRGPHFLMGLADLKNTFTGTIYLPDRSAKIDVPGVEEVPTFEELDADPAKLKAYLDEQYPNVPVLVPDFREQLAQRPPGLLATTHVSHWNYRGDAVVFGDAAHGVVPFFGQGMNCGFESWVVLLGLMVKHGFTGEGRAGAFEEFTKIRRPNSEAIALMAEQNFVEMSFKVGQASFLRQKAVENAVEKMFPLKLRSRYYMVVATLIPYKDVLDCGLHIDACVQEIIALIDGLNDSNRSSEIAEPPLAGLSKAQIEGCIDKHVTPFLVEHGIKLGEPLKTFYAVDLEARAKL